MTEIEVHYQNIESEFNWENIFGNSAPVEIEVGFGKCGFLIGHARANPDVNFLGIEVSRKYYRKGVKKIQCAELKNVRLLWGEAFHVFKRYIPDESVTHIYVNFPDPWPKKRHAKRRLLSREFLDVSARKLLPERCLEIATDVETYMADTLELLRSHERFDYVYSLTHAELNQERPYRSDYEQVFFEEGKSLYYTKYRRI
ncbi:tRNA (guanosine(46)-N7)-methyltransferase TrmB [candidate division KSB3 bacterium]|uniref:tRNA (guanine-N(7)-)-methyltransferase n=1 Tax=candidate division KSB3 bacterium TaxID=2044937 RepID=A0A2G6KFK8_9BACT|nr:MAG: tRNA (guanosine(46)-N7)-methyltransferase TrmB [candidate division KSB3 bacterium]